MPLRRAWQGKKPTRPFEPLDRLLKYRLLK
jgi:hypothetical protein